MNHHLFKLSPLALLHSSTSELPRDSRLRRRRRRASSRATASPPVVLDRSSGRIVANQLCLLLAITFLNSSISFEAVTLVAAWIPTTTPLSSARERHHRRATTVQPSTNWILFASSKTPSFSADGKASEKRKSGSSGDSSSHNGNGHSQPKPKKQQGRRPAFAQAAHVAVAPRQATRTTSAKVDKTASPAIANTNLDVVSATSATKNPTSTAAAAESLSWLDSSTSSNSDDNALVNRRSKSRRNNADGKLMEAHAHRVSTAGRVGTKRHINPCKVYLGNLDFSVTADDVRAWLVDHMGVPAHVLLSSGGGKSQHGCHVVTNWQTGRSKGYAFCVFTEPMYATVAMETLNGKTWHNRSITVSQGVPHESKLHQLQLQEIYVQKQAARAAAAAAAIASGNTTAPKTEPIFMDEYEATMLKRLDPDLLEGVTIVKESKQQTNVMEQEDDDDEYDGFDEFDMDDTMKDDTDLLLEDDYDTDDFDDKGFIEDDDEESMVVVEDGTNSTAALAVLNREQRRDVARRTPRQKKPSKGFGN